MIGFIGSIIGGFLSKLVTTVASWFGLLWIGRKLQAADDAKATNDAAIKSQETTNEVETMDDKQLDSYLERLHKPGTSQ